MSEVRCELELEGRLQGVGFRPLAFRLARELGLTGWVRNTTQGVTLALQGQPDGVAEFERRIAQELPAHATIRRSTRRTVALCAQTGFAIAPSTAGGERSAELLPDLATCAACAREVMDPSDRRYRYAFTSCTHCGPRYSVICQLCSEIFCVRGYVDDALAYFKKAAESVLTDIEWVDRCPLLAPMRQLPGYDHIRRKVRARVDAMWVV